MARAAKDDRDVVAIKVKEEDDNEEEEDEDDVVEPKSEERLRRKKRRRRGPPSSSLLEEVTAPRGRKKAAKTKEKKKPEAAVSSAKRKKKKSDEKDSGIAKTKGTSSKESEGEAEEQEQEEEEEQSPKKKKKKNDGGTGSDDRHLPAARDANWLKRFEELKTFREIHGHLNVTSRHNVPTLHRWVCYQRKQMDRLKRGEPNHAMTDERRIALDGLGFWSVEEDDDDEPTTKEERSKIGQKRDANWKKKFEELKAFKAKHGHLRVQTSSSSEFRGLYKWVSYQREQLRRRERGEPNGLTDERLALLEGLGLDFDGTQSKDGPESKPRAKRGLAQRDDDNNNKGSDGKEEKEEEEEEAASAEEEDGTPQKKICRRRPKEIDLIRWQERLEELRAFRSTHGHIRPRKETHTQLYNWVQQQRRQYLELQRGKGFGMTPQKIEAFEELGFRWKTEKQQWDDRLEELRAFREVHGHCNVSGKTLTSDNPKLGKWVGNQRALYKLKNEGKPTSLTDERQQKLEELGIEWSRAPPRKKVRPRKKVPPPHFLSPPPPAAASTSPTKPNDRQPSDAALETETKMPPPPPTPKIQPTSPYVRRYDESADDFAPTWEEMFFSLVVYKARHGDCIIPATYDGQPGLAQWVWQQRRLYKKRRDAEERAVAAVDGDDPPKTTIELTGPNGLTDDRIAALETVGFVWNAIDYKWSKQYEELVKYHKEHGNADVPKAKTGLGKWLSLQKDACRALSEGRELSSCGITRERVEKLEALGVTYERMRPKPTDWDVRFDELVEFYSKHGHTCVPQVYEENRPLGKWVTKQRYHYSLRQKGKPHQMYDNRLEALENLGFQWSAVGRRGNKSATRPEENYGLPQHHKTEEEEEGASAGMEEEGHEAAEDVARARAEAADDRTDDIRRVLSSSSAVATETATYGSSGAEGTTTMTTYGASTAEETTTTMYGNDRGSFRPPALPPMDQSLV